MSPPTDDVFVLATVASFLAGCTITSLIWLLCERSNFMRKFRKQEAEIERRHKELDERIARGCRRTTGTM
jgi:hypothetical protein